MCPVPVTDWAVEARVPVEREEQHGTVVVMGEDVNHGMNHAAEDEGQPPMSVRVGFVHEAPEQDGIEDERGRRVQEVVAGNPPGIVEIGRMDDIFHQGTGILLEDEAVVNIRPPREQAKGNIG